MELDFASHFVEQVKVLLLMGKFNFGNLDIILLLKYSLMLKSQAMLKTPNQLL